MHTTGGLALLGHDVVIFIFINIAAFVRAGQTPVNICSYLVHQQRISFGSGRTFSKSPNNAKPCPLAASRQQFVNLTLQYLPMIKVTMKSLVDDFGYYFKKYGITQKQLKDNYEKDQSIADYAWSILNKILLEIAGAYQNSKITLEDFYNKTADTYQQMAYLLNLEKKDSRKIQSLQFENEVKYMELAYSNLIGVKILSYGCCDGCHPFNNRILTIEEALEFAKTTETRCQPRFGKSSRCTFIPEIKEEENSPIKLTVTFGH